MASSLGPMLGRPLVQLDSSVMMEMETPMMETPFKQLAGRGPELLSASVIDSGVFSDLTAESQGNLLALVI